MQALELDEKALVNAFEVEELEKRYEMGWFKSGGTDLEISTDFNGNVTVKGGVHGNW
ncbi:hypothetical protein RCZ04_22540 [Capnocytophaga sp. HP1101]